MISALCFSAGFNLVLGLGPIFTHLHTSGLARIYIHCPVISAVKYLPQFDKILFKLGSLLAYYHQLFFGSKIT